MCGPVTEAVCLWCALRVGRLRSRGGTKYCGRDDLRRCFGGRGCGAHPGGGRAGREATASVDRCRIDDRGDARSDRVRDPPRSVRVPEGCRSSDVACGERSEPAKSRIAERWHKKARLARAWGEWAILDSNQGPLPYQRSQGPGREVTRGYHRHKVAAMGLVWDPTSDACSRAW